MPAEGSAHPGADEPGTEAVTLDRAGRRTGLTIRSSVDCLIAACALRHGLTMLHHDRDFDVLARVSALGSRDVLRA
jgi:hypothetical protein